jgi:ABC-type sugar transport system permease subunit
MWPSIMTAIVLHRLKSERWQYVYRVLFVVPMVIPALVGLLIWKSFYDPLIGPLNRFLRGTGLMSLLAWLDVRMPLLSTKLMPLVEHLVEPLFYSVWGMLVAGVLLVSAAGGIAVVRRSLLYWVIIVGLCAAFMGVGDGIGGVVRFLVWVAGSLVAGELLVRRRGAAGRSAMRWTGAAVIGLACLLIVGATLWTSPVGQFDSGTPGWLSNSKLIVPSLILWGFPWVGTVGVLLYLAGLQNISQDVYEAAEIDGVGSIGKLFYIELPLILAQVRINLIFLTIGTLTDYGLFLLLLGSEGGPGGVGMVPGLYMYRSAFVDGEFGYACALGIILAAIILFITVFYQKYVTVEK